MIDYEKIATAVKYYGTCNYKYMDVPWFVSLDTMLITRPAGTRLFSTFAGELVASGEQSFLHIRDSLKPGKYQCVTPCFRDEKQDELHLQYFMKNELIWVLEYRQINVVDLIIDEALIFFKKYGKAYIVDAPLDNSFVNKDIMINGIEVGSYGLREIDGFTWVYGTGIAEPRLTQALKVKYV